MSSNPYDRQPAGRTLSNQTTTTTISVQPTNNLSNYTHQKLTLSKSRETLNSTSYLTSNAGLGQGQSSSHHSISSPYKAPLSNQNSIGATSISKMIADPSHPCHHNNVFETLHNINLPKEEKTERLLNLLRKSQSKQRHWTTGLCNCCANKQQQKHLCYQCFLGPIYQGCQAERMGEDFFTGCCMGSFLGLPLSCVPWLNGNGAMISLRTKIRERHNILGAIFEDWLIYLCCLGNCANVQLYRELDELGYPDSWLG